LSESLPLPYRENAFLDLTYGMDRCWRSERSFPFRVLIRGRMSVFPGDDHFSKQASDTSTDGGDFPRTVFQPQLTGLSCIVRLFQLFHRVSEGCQAATFVQVIVGPTWCSRWFSLFIDCISEKAQRSVSDLGPSELCSHCDETGKSELTLVCIIV
jgi:hypothetical protein